MARFSPLYPTEHFKAFSGATDRRNSSVLSTKQVRDSLIHTVQSYPT